MRTLPEEANFAKFLLDVGDGVLNDDDNNFIIPDRCLAIADSDALERRLLGLLGGVSQELDKVIQKSNGKQTGPYAVSHVSIIFINFFLIKKRMETIKL